jgi:hypothetical protein
MPSKSPSTKDKVALLLLSASVNIDKFKHLEELVKQQGHAILMLGDLYKHQREEIEDLKKQLKTESEDEAEDDAMSLGSEDSSDSDCSDDEPTESDKEFIASETDSESEESETDSESEESDHESKWCKRIRCD